MIIFFGFITLCKKNSTESDVEYLDLQWIFLGQKATWEDTNTNLSGTVRNIKCFYRGDSPDVSDSFFEGSVDYVQGSWYKCKWINYYEDDGYIEYEVIGEDLLESFPIYNYLVEYKKS